MANYSLSEIDALARKATRGAGYSWGIAEEVGKSVRWLSAYGFSGSEILAEYLSSIAEKQSEFIPCLEKDVTHDGDFIFSNNKKPMCSVYSGALINDLGHHLVENRVLSFCNMASPLLALPSVARIAEAYDISLSFNYAETSIFCSPSGICINDTPHLLSTFSSKDCVDVICQSVQPGFKNNHFPHSQGRPIEKGAVMVLEKFAHKTYAPDTEESRLRGAG